MAFEGFFSTGGDRSPQQAILDELQTRRGRTRLVMGHGNSADFLSDCWVLNAPVSVCVLAESQEIKALLSEQGVVVQTVAEVLPIRVMSARVLSQIYVRLGNHASSPLLQMCV